MLRHWSGARQKNVTTTRHRGALLPIFEAIPAQVCSNGGLRQFDVDVWKAIERRTTSAPPEARPVLRSKQSG
jgi:hypothetical protein